MNRCFALPMLWVALVPAGVAAHEYRDIEGTIASISKTEIIVKTFGGINEWAAVAPDTKVVRGTKSVSLRDLKKGLRVIVHAIAHGDYVEANTIELLPAAKKIKN